MGFIFYKRRYLDLKTEADLAGKPVAEIFIDQGGTLSLINGVYRLTLTQMRFDDGEAVEIPGDGGRPVGRLFIPAEKLDAVVDGIVKAVGDIAVQLKERVETAPEVESNPTIEIAPVPMPPELEIDLDQGASPKRKSKWGFDVLKRLIGD